MSEKRMTYSHSRLETFESCRLRFKYQYIERPEVLKRTSVEAFLGVLVHETLEALYKNKLMGKAWVKEEFLNFFADSWQKEKSDDIFIVNRQYSPDDYFRQGHAALEKYWDRYFPFEGEKTIALEKRVDLFLDDGKEFRLTGIIDRVSKTEDGVWQIRDYKTKRTLPTLQEARVDRQLALYQIGLQSMWENTENVELIWHYLLFDEEIRSTRERSDLEKLKIETIHLIQEVEKAIAADDLAYNESALCDWCDYFDICPAKKHLSQIRKLPAREFKRDQGVGLVDRFTHLRDERRRIDQELEQLEELIYQFAAQFAIDKVYGSDRRVSIRERKTFRAPAREVAAERTLRDQLEHLIKSHHLWDAVSQLNSQRLVKMFENKELPPVVREQLSAFLSPYTDRRLFVNKLKDYDENFER